MLPVCHCLVWVLVKDAFSWRQKLYTYGLYTFFGT